MISVLPCCVDVPAPFFAAARYAVHELLGEIGMTPEFVGREDLGDRGMYYGPAGASLPPGILSVPHAEDVVSYFESGEAYSASDSFFRRFGNLDVPVLFPRGGGDPDLVASAFFWLSGWQEKAVRTRDVHGRFPFSASLQAQLGTAGVPVVDHYRLELARRLKALGIEARPVRWAGAPWAVCLTHDIDQGRKRRAGTVVRALRRRDGLRRAAIAQALGSPDPRMDSISSLAHLARRHGAGATFFFKAGGTGPYDSAYRIDSKPIRARLRDLEVAGFEIGIHPSYHAADHRARMEEEVHTMESVLGYRPASVRLHFLRFDPERTPRLLEQMGFLRDSSLGFSAMEGFRRGTCFPFRLWDLNRAEALELVEIPLCVMDTTLFTHRSLDPEGALDAAWRILEAGQRVGGCPVVLWHNTCFDELDYPGEAGVLSRLLERATDAGAAVLGVSQATGSRDPRGVRIRETANT